MELVLIYLVTRLTELKDNLTLISAVSGVLLAAGIVVWFINEFGNKAKVKDTPEGEAVVGSEEYVYHAYKRVFRRSLRYLAPLFAVSFVVNALLPSSRDAVTIAGGYGLVAAVKNERVQRLFQKSTQVAAKWISDEMGPEDTPAASTTPASPASAETPGPASTAVPASGSTAASPPIVATVNNALVTAQKIGEAASQVQGALAAVNTAVTRK